MQHKFPDKIRIKRQKGILRHLPEPFPDLETKQSRMQQMYLKIGPNRLPPAAARGPRGQIGKNNRRKPQLPLGDQQKRRQNKEIT